MKLKALFFGAIGTIAETSDVQRRAFNLAFSEAGLTWNWDAETYRRLLHINGGQPRITAYAAQIGADPLTHDQLRAIHTAKTAQYEALLASEGLVPRAGVANLLSQCAAAGVLTGLCTSTSIENVRAMEAALQGQIDFGAFAIITTLRDGIGVKPLPDAYRFALVQLGLKPDVCIAIEDSPVSVMAAKAAGLFTIATPGLFVQDQDFAAADWVCDDLSAVSLDQLDAGL
jgi:HAD superfamily hydrolase (TIGR01509 family)